MLMANSVEGRFPFLDPNLVDFAASLPAAHKLLGLQEKYLLKRAFADLVPERILQRPKQPYRVPDAESFLADGTPAWIGEVTSAEQVAAAGVFEPAAVAMLLAKGRRSGGAGMSNTDNMRLLAVISTQLLHSGFIAGDALGGVEPPLADPLVAVDRIVDLRGVR
jgi:asparagine synthase (glutamine-hydrolysing)